MVLKILHLTLNIVASFTSIVTKYQISKVYDKERLRLDPNFRGSRPLW